MMGRTAGLVLIMLSASGSTVVANNPPRKELPPCDEDRLRCLWAQHSVATAGGVSGLNTLARLLSGGYTFSAEGTSATGRSRAGFNRISKKNERMRNENDQ